MTIDKSWFDEMEGRIPHGQIRTRFAPSPTGYMHVGNLRTALYTWLIARHGGGRFLLRIEDTDQGRLVEDAVDVIYATMRRCGLDWDEGPDVGGPVGPYIQTQRRDLYGRYAQLLIEKGHAYRCFCSEERLARLHQDDPNAKYDRHCLSLSPEEIQARLDAGEPYVIRQRIPEGSTTFRDAVYGDITVDNAELDDQILIKSDGLPTYNFANVIDDHLMGITHVVRGAEYLSSAPKYDLLYRAFGWEIPTYVHCSSVMFSDPATGTVRKMSKRHGDPSYEDLVAQGYLSQAVVNYVALLGWAPHGELAEQEFFTMDQLVRAFEIEGISKSPSAFDMDKLNYFNAAYLRGLAPEDFAREARPWIRRAVKDERYDAAAIAGLLQARCEKLSDIPEKVDFFDELPEYDAELFTNKKSKTNAEVSLRMLQEAVPVLAALPEWEQDAIHGALVGLAEGLGVKNATLMWPLRIAVAGKAVTPGGAVELCRILGREETLRRAALGMDKLNKLV